MSKTEKDAAGTLLENGVVFTTKRKRLTWLFGKERKWYIQPSKLGTLYLLSQLYLEYELNEADLTDNPRKAANELAAKATKNYARIAAIAVLNSKWKIRLFARPLASYFLWNITPKQLFQITMIVIEANNVLDFMSSIRLTSGVAKMLAPKTNLSPSEQGG